MRKALLAFGVVLVFAGVLVSLWSNLLVEKIEASLVSRVEDRWEASGVFSEGEKLFVDWEPPKWEERIPLPAGDHALYYVTVLAPLQDDGETNLTVRFYLSGDVNVTVSSSGGLSNFSSTVIGGVAQCSGTYVVRMDKTARFYYLGSPPSYIQLWTETVKTDYLYLGALPIGVALIVAGASLSIWAAKSSRYVSKARRKSRNLRRSSISSV